MPRRQGLSKRAIATRLGRAPLRSTGSCGATPLHTTEGGCDPVLAHAGPTQPSDSYGPGYWPTTSSCTRWSGPRSSWTGPCSKSPCHCDASIRSARSGTCATRRSTNGTRRGLHRRLTAWLSTGRSMRQRPDQWTPRFVAPRLLIDRCPTVIEERVRIGDWEGDLIVGRERLPGDRDSGRAHQPVRPPGGLTPRPRRAGPD